MAEMIRLYVKMLCKLLQSALILVLFFLLSRFLFFLYQWQQTSSLSLAEIGLCFVHGFRHDVSITGYLLLLMIIGDIPGILLSGKRYGKLYRLFFFMLFFLLSFTVAADMELFRNWGFRLDSTPLLYIDHPKEMLASLSFFTFLKVLGLMILLWGFLVIGFQKWIWKDFYFNTSFLCNRIFLLLLWLITGTILIIPMRGGLSKATLNPGSVYFSNNSFANQAAVNVIFNLGFSLTHSAGKGNPYILEDSAGNYLSMLNQQGKEGAAFPILLKKKQANVLLIILESFTSKVIGALGGEMGITPVMDEYAKTGILFSSIYSNGSRSDRGIAALLSGFPGLPARSIMQDPRKIPNLPFLSEDFARIGYSTFFVHGGDLGFGSMNSYLRVGGFQKILSLENFQRKDINSAWGVHDQLVFDSLYQIVSMQKDPFFGAMFTLSSHEPFDIPAFSRFSGGDEPALFKNAIYYTDSCLGVFLKKAQSSAWWDNTLVILVADHGSRHPGESHIDDPLRYKIPMIWTGGAIRKDTVIHQIASQSDLATTLLAQFGMPSENYIFSRNILSPEYSPQAIFFYNDGLGYISDSVSFAFDNTVKKVTFNENNSSGEQIKTARIYLQAVYEYYLSR